MEIKLNNKIINSIMNVIKKNEKVNSTIRETNNNTMSSEKNDTMPSTVISKAEKELKDDLDSRKTVVLDFDGVVHAYRKGWHDGTIYDDPVPGIKETIQELRTKYNVVIVSTRCKDAEGIFSIKEWLEFFDIKVDDVLAEKPPAFVYVDDRAICFNGNCKNLVRDINNFSSYVDRGRKICEYCGKEFFHSNGGKKYCSSECKIRHNIEKERNGKVINNE